MVKIHLWKSELAICIRAIEIQVAKEKPEGVALDIIKATTKKLTTAYNLAER